ncbi:MAG: LamG domain-containing protein [Bacteroidaceae bacterium]|nr:LamG domain-containing protein [Bacteroidaceae bacterium]
MERLTIRLKQVLGLLLLIVAIMTGQSAFAAINFEDSCMIIYHPSATNPFIEIRMAYYDEKGNNSFFTHDVGHWSANSSGGYDGHKGPAIYVDGYYIGSPDEELAWPGSGSGNSSGAENFCNNNSWAGKTYSQTINGVEYKVRFYDPKRFTSNTLGIYMYVYLSRFEVDKTHKVRIHGFWKTNNSGTREVNYEMTTYPVPAPWGDNNTPSGTMTSYNQVKISGGLNSSYETVVGLYSNSPCTKPNSYVAEGSLKNASRFNGVSSYNLTATHSRGDAEQDAGSTTAVEYLASRTANGLGTTIFWKWYDVNVPGYVKPVNVEAKPNQWTKTIVVKWERETSDNRNQSGTWSVYRDGRLIASDLPYNKNPLQYEDAASNSNGPEWDDMNTSAPPTSKTYKVAFIPSGASNDPPYTSLSATADDPVQLVRVWQFYHLTGVLDGDDKVKLTWRHSPIEDASPSKKYTMTLERTDDGNNWVTIKEISISSPNTEEGEHTDTGLEAQHGYKYRLKVRVMERDYDVTSDYINTNGSSILSFTATRGTYSNVVKLSWEVKQSGVNETHFRIWRRPLGTTGDNGWVQIHATSGTSTHYSYDDETVLPGAYNQYKLCIVGAENDDVLTDGFTYSTGVISGRVKYGTGTAVEGVKVTLKQQNADGDLSTAGMSSLGFLEKGSGMIYETEPSEIQQLFASDYSFQMWLRPDGSLMPTTGLNYFVYDVYYVTSLYMRRSSDGFQLVPYVSANWYSNVTIPADQWSHVTVSYSHETDSLKITAILPDGTIKKDVRKVAFEWTDRAKTAKALQVVIHQEEERGYRGYMDEFRFFTKALTEKEILRNYNHPLAGNEDGLAVYYPFDEGLPSQKIAYDYSKTNGIPNGRHGISKSVAAYSSSTIVPNENQFSMMAYTDINGNYTIRGVHFQGEGTGYSVIPTMAIHEFSPREQSRFVSASSLIHNGVDFEDISSFPVSGIVRYSNTTYPVEGVSFYVDGVACTKNNEMITTNSDGEFTISVPIGQHYIEARKDGHVFVNNGRYPADPNNAGEKYTFDREIKGLEFRDTTLVNFAGRVVGGDIEGEKTLGFALSENNIGVTQLVLTPLRTEPRMNTVRVVEGTVVRDSINEAPLPILSATPVIHSTSWRGEGIDKYNMLFIETDPITGEFSALVPPVEYSVSSMKVLHNRDIDFGELPVIDLSNPSREVSDTLTLDDGSTEVYTCHAILKQTYHSEPTFTVRQEGRKDGSFGIKSYKFKDELREVTIDDIYTVDDNNNVIYNYGVDGHHAPLFIQENPYTFLLEGFEQYENYDENETSPVVSKVPLRDVVVTINNALSDNQVIWMVSGEVTVDGETYDAQEGQVMDLKSNQLPLDEFGCATYVWNAGLPNVAEPFTRTISMNYEINGRHYQWSGSGMEGIILGDLPTGNNFVTSGPDKLVMILRDPPGTGSSAEWSTGTATSTARMNNDTWSDSAETGWTWHIGHKTNYFHAEGTQSIGTVQFVAQGFEIEDKDDLTIHASMENEGERGQTIETSVSITEAVATSEEPDFVGADGDVFVGQATNIIFGNARHLGFMTDGNDFEIGLRNVISTGLSFGTVFSYTQSYIENTLFPNLEMLRQNLLRPATEAEIAAFNPVDSVGTHNQGKDKGNFYYTTLSPEDEHYGEKGTYYVIVPEPPANVPTNIHDGVDLLQWHIREGYASCDSVQWINDQLKSWKNYLALNEKEKVRAYELREDRDSVECVNYSFDGGASRSYSWESDSTHTSSWEWSVSAGLVVANRLGYEISEKGRDWELELTSNGGRHESKDSTNVTTTSFSYTLAEEGEDALSVDVYRYGGFSPIFRTRGGQTSNPYEGKVVTNYYEPGTTIMEATMQIEVPQILAEVEEITDVPSGSPANFVLYLSNASEIGADVAYKLYMIDETNPNGAQISIDGKVLTEDGRMIKVPGGQTLTKALQLRQTNVGILDYENIGIAFASESQPDDIVSVVYLTARFTPSSSPVTLALSNPTMNTQTGTDLTLTFKDYDRHYFNQKAFRLQCKLPGDANWTQLKEYVINEDDKTDNNEMLPDGAYISYTLPMGAWSDGNYLFRVVSAATYGTSEVVRYSDELPLVKDMMRPRPLGTPEPTDGVLDIGDDLSVTFNETIVKGELTKLNNFLVTGVLNGAEVAHETALAMTNTSAAAQTEASINLSGKDFSIDSWVNIGGAGTLLSHGQGQQKLTVGIDDTGKLEVNIAGNTYTSLDAVPTDKWAFLTMNVTAAGKLTATIASADEVVELFKGTDIVAYQGNGPLAVGKGMTGAIHELLLWDEAHDITTALLNRSKTKAPSTRHLIGYWKMDEGEGKEIRDYSRNRHMIMPDETWYINNENKAVTLDGQHYIGINASILPTTTADDYALEFWMRGGEQTGEAQLMQMGDIALWLDADGKLQLTGKSAYNPAEATTLSTSSGSLNDNAWHHIALNVLRQGAAAVYVDGKRCLTTNASNVGNIVTNKMIVGARRTTVSAADASYSFDRAFAGEVDEIRVWNASMNGDYLSKNRKIRFTGSEVGLVAYYPFEIKTLDAYNQVVTLGYDKDLTGSGFSAQLNSLNSELSTLNYVDEAPALRTKPTETNVTFTFTASDEKIVIDIDEDPATIEGCTLNFTVKEARDVNGNYCDPVIWSAFVNRNELTWQEDVVSVEQEVTDESSFTATIVNKGGKQQSWTLTGMPSWLTASADYGTTNPRSETSITFNVSPATPIGKYEETVYLEGSNGIATPLTVNVKVTGPVPNWAVNPGDFENSMNVISRVEIEGLPMDDEDDIVAAFIGEECRGVAHPVYKERYDGSYITIDIYGNNEVNQDVTFRAYDASTGALYPVVTPDRDIKFTPLALIGRYDEPVVFTVADLIEQQTELKAGWNWLSLYVTPKDMTVPGVFEKIADDVLNVKSQHDGYLTYENNTWGGNLTDSLDNTQMYAVQLKSDRTLRVVGRRINPDSTLVTVEEGWNWIGYYGRQVSSLDNALAGLQPETGDILKGQSGVAYFDTYEWAGSLSMMQPGIGYMLKSNTSYDRQFSYPLSTVSTPYGLRRARNNASYDATEEEVPSAFTPINFRTYSNNAIMAVQVMAGGRIFADTELGVFAGDECRAAARTNEDGIAFITIPGDEATMLTFKVVINEELIDAPQTVDYEVDGVYGSPMYPLVIDLSGATGIWRLAGDGNDAVYDLQGRKIVNGESSKRILQRGVYIINGQKKAVK